jgi:hypothetical protein
MLNLNEFNELQNFTESIILACSQSRSSTDEVRGKRKKSLQKSKDAKRVKKLEKRNLQTVDSDDDLGDLTDSFSSRCSSHDSDDWKEMTGRKTGRITGMNLG